MTGVQTCALPICSWQTESEGKVSLSALDFRVSRPLFEIDGKDVMLGMGVDIKQEKVNTQYNPDVISAPSFGFKRQNQAAYGELQVPVTPSWDVIASLRTDRYSDVGSTTNAKVASRWAINSQWALRGGGGHRVQGAITRSNLGIWQQLPPIDFDPVDEL